MKGSFPLMAKLAVSGYAGAAAAASEPTPTAVPSNPLTNLPTVRPPGKALPPNPGMEQARTLGQWSSAMKPPSGLLATLSDVGWQLAGPQFNPRQMLGSPFEGHPTTYVPPQYRRAHSAANYANATFRPYEPGLTAGAQTMQSFAPLVNDIVPGLMDPNAW